MAEQTNDHELFFVVDHPVEDLAGLSSGLGLVVVKEWKRGNEVGAIQGSKHSRSCCIMALPGSEDGVLADEIKSALWVLKKNKQTLDTLSATGGRLSLLVFWSLSEAESFVLQQNIKAELLQEMADLHISLDLQIKSEIPVGEP
ncbi:MAG TPA: hypothetical protein VGH02_06225 [Rhizomicrobium sp.]|jgi:hypothetical protein